MGFESGPEEERNHRKRETMWSQRHGSSGEKKVDVGSLQGEQKERHRRPQRGMRLRGAKWLFKVSEGESRVSDFCRVHLFWKLHLCSDLQILVTRKSVEGGVCRGDGWELFLVKRARSAAQETEIL